MSTLTAYTPMIDSITGKPHECNLYCKEGLHCKVVYARRISPWLLDDARDAFRVQCNVWVERLIPAPEAPPANTVKHNFAPSNQCADWSDGHSYFMFYRHLDGGA